MFDPTLPALLKSVSQIGMPLCCDIVVVTISAAILHPLISPQSEIGGQKLTSSNVIIIGSHKEENLCVMKRKAVGGSPGVVFSARNYTFMKRCLINEQRPS